MGRKIVQPTSKILHQIAARMRTDGVQDLLDAAGMSNLEAVTVCAKNSLYCQAWIVDGEAACLFGLTTPSVTSNTGEPWVIITDIVLDHKIEFLRACRKMMGWWLARRPVLIGTVERDHEESIRWLRWLGFDVDLSQPGRFINFELKG